MARVSVARLLVLAATLTAALLAAAPPPTRAAWVESDYPSSMACGVTIPVEQCDPADGAANAACRDMCHYGGRRGGRCVAPGRLALVQGCHCRC
ncbi:hypothetical protein PAHAL_9G188500 [Panicum hallii]|uniref:Knottin scorpion toxin-like domain-containing protein n=1 Tax=Panicum hallii TaxID=206008 RepID=A0A2S3IKT3_9POAL|nr:hypothetical protein PAHAL_9G188500 [Panicum hallii]